MDRFFGLETPALSDEGVSLLTTLYDTVAAELTAALLTEEGIPFLKKDRGTGGMMRILAGVTLSPIDIYVPDARLDEARELLAAMAEDGENGEDAEEVEE